MNIIEVLDSGLIVDSLFFLNSRISIIHEHSWLYIFLCQIVKKRIVQREQIKKKMKGEKVGSGVT